MSDEDALSQATARAVRAQALLGNELLLEGWDNIEAALIEGWIGSNPRDVEGREAAWRMIHANRKHKSYLHTVLDQGKLAAAELKANAESLERKQRFGII